MPELDKETTRAMTAIAEIRNVQLNEKVSETEYQILHPETKADQVITNPLKRFVTDDEKKKWNKSADDNINALHYKGEWMLGEIYKKHDVVYWKNNTKPDQSLSNVETDSVLMFYICVDENENGTQATVYNQPGLNLSNPSHEVSGLWINIDFRSYLASRSQTTRIASSTEYNVSGDTLITFVQKGTHDYRTICIDDEFIYNPVTNTLKVINIEATKVVAGTFEGNLKGTADNAINYVAYPRDENGQKIEGEATNVELDETIVGIKKTLENITNGGTGIVLGNPLTITKDGENAVVFDGSFPTIIDIKQTYNPKEIDDLLDSTDKIKVKWLPESVLGQLEYKGTWNANPTPRPSEVDTTKQVKGHYYIARVNGNYNPDGSLAGSSADMNPTYYLVGDWAVYNGTSWDKVDNTDAVTMVNGQIGAVEIYKTWFSQRNYYRGDIIGYRTGEGSRLLYICNTNHTSSGIFEIDLNAGYWDLFGRSYTATDGIKIENDSIIKHDTANPNATGNTTSQNITLTKEQIISVPKLTYDNFGHVSKVEIQNITLGDDFVDTVREVRVKGTKVLDKTDKTTALDFRSTTWISPVFEGNLLYFNHKDNGTLGAVELGAKKVTETVSGEDILYAGQGYSIPSFSVDAAGHIVAGVVKNFKIADNFFKHSHFDIAKDKDGSLVIGAFPAATATPAWVADPDNVFKFYLGAVNPALESQMNFNGILNAVKFRQKGNDVLDITIKLFNGVNMVTGNRLIGTYNATEGWLEAPDSGVVAGVYSAVAVNSKGIVSAGGHIVEFGKTKNADPSDSLAVGGLFFRWKDTGDANA